MLRLSGRESWVTAEMVVHGWEVFLDRTVFGCVAGILGMVKRPQPCGGEVSGEAKFEQACQMRVYRQHMSRDSSLLRGRGKTGERLRKRP